MTYSFCQTSCSEYRDMSMDQKYAAYAVSTMAESVSGWMRAFIGVCLSSIVGYRLAMSCRMATASCHGIGSLQNMSNIALNIAAAKKRVNRVSGTQIGAKAIHRIFCVGVSIFFARPFLFPRNHDWTLNFTQEVKRLLHGNPQPPEENTQ